MRHVIGELNAQSAKVLTTHSLSEADQLCSKLGILINGELACLGTSQHLKTKFSSGYELDIICNESMTEQVKEYVFKELQGTLLEAFAGHMKFTLTGKVGLSNLFFSAMEERKKGLQISTYCISHISLEQVFIRFAKQQLD